MSLIFRGGEQLTAADGSVSHRADWAQMESWWQVFRVAVENGFATDQLKATWKTLSGSEGWKSNPSRGQSAIFGIRAREAN